jgi:hypothetical protein
MVHRSCHQGNLICNSIFSIIFENSSLVLLQFHIHLLGTFVPSNGFCGQYVQLKEVWPICNLYRTSLCTNGITNHLKMTEVLPMVAVLLS